MGDVTQTQPRTKDIGSSIHYPMLTSTNYTVWSMRMKVLLRVQDVWETIDPGSTNPKKNNVAVALLFQSIPETLILQIGDHATAKEIWEAIKSRHLGADRVREARLQTLMAEFDRLTMSQSDMVDDFAENISTIALKLNALGESIEESKLVKKFLKGLPRSKFIHIVASLEQVLDLNSTSFEDIVGRLKAYEERIKEENNEEDQGKLMMANDDSSYHGGYRGNRGRGGRRGGRGGGRGRGGSKVVCWRCDKPGHYVAYCPERKIKYQEANHDQEVNHDQEANHHEADETQEADALYMHEVVFLDEEKEIQKKPPKIHVGIKGENVG